MSEPDSWLTIYLYGTFISRWAEINAPQTPSEERGKRMHRKEEIYSLLSLLYSLSFLQAGIQGFTVGNKKCN